MYDVEKETIRRTLCRKKLFFPFKMITSRQGNVDEDHEKMGISFFNRFGSFHSGQAKRLFYCHRTFAFFDGRRYKRNIVHISLKILLQSYSVYAIITTSISGKSGSSDRKSVSLF